MSNDHEMSGGSLGDARSGPAAGAQETQVTFVFQAPAPTSAELEVENTVRCYHDNNFTRLEGTGHLVTTRESRSGVIQSVDLVDDDSVSHLSAVTVINGATVTKCMTKDNAAVSAVRFFYRNGPCVLIAYKVEQVEEEWHHPLTLQGRHGAELQTATEREFEELKNNHWSELNDLQVTLKEAHSQELEHLETTLKEAHSQELEHLETRLREAHSRELELVETRHVERSQTLKRNQTNHVRTLNNQVRYNVQLVNQLKDQLKAANIEPNMEVKFNPIQPTGGNAGAAAIAKRGAVDVETANVRQPAKKQRGNGETFVNPAPSATPSSMHASSSGAMPEAVKAEGSPSSATTASVTAQTLKNRVKRDKRRVKKREAKAAAASMVSTPTADLAHSMHNEDRELQPRGELTKSIHNPFTSGSGSGQASRPIPVCDTIPDYGPPTTRTAGPTSTIPHRPSPQAEKGPGEDTEMEGTQAKNSEPRRPGMPVVPTEEIGYTPKSGDADYVPKPGDPGRSSEASDTAFAPDLDGAVGGKLADELSDEIGWSE
ncbi:hypothetical protein HYQ45_013039 [Verticillium longisporum]|uniref:Uncharacterized protein n=1 Tax=Verticillium longisporum TaxID=100787 RepID=A0A8I2ZBC4_VERLO|nr:hypothetical protein HYQ45_013039 [Verticillium longisporum]